MPVPVAKRNSRLPGISASWTSVPTGFGRMTISSPAREMLEPRGQRAVLHLDRVELELVVPGRRGDGIGAHQRLAVDHQPDHHELARAEAEALRALAAEREGPVRPVPDVARPSSSAMPRRAFSTTWFIVSLTRESPALIHAAARNGNPLPGPQAAAPRTTFAKSGRAAPRRSAPPAGRRAGVLAGADRSRAERSFCSVRRRPVERHRPGDVPRHQVVDVALVAEAHQRAGGAGVVEPDGMADLVREHRLRSSAPPAPGPRRRPGDLRVEADRRPGQRRDAARARRRARRWRRRCAAARPRRRSGCRAPRPARPAGSSRRPRGSRWRRRRRRSPPAAPGRRPRPAPARPSAPAPGS